MTQWQPEYDPRQQPPQTPPQWGGRQYPPPQPQYQPQGYGPQYPQPPQQPRKSRKGITCLGCGGVAALFIIIAVIAGSKSSSPSAPSAAPAQTQAAVPVQTVTPAKAPVAVKAKTVATFSGSGVQSTPPFTVTASWRLDYNFDCSSFGYAGNFIIMEDGGLAGAMDVNTLAMTKSGTSYAYNDAGQHYIKVDSECSWSIKVIDEG